MASPLKMELTTNWDEMGSVYDRAAQYFASSGLSEDAANTYTMVVCELVENGIKYGQAIEGEHGSVQVHVEVKNRTVTIQVTNAVGKTTRNHLPDLDRTIQWVRGYQDPFQAFVERMKEISREPVNLPKSGLGIVRVAYEGRAALDFILGEDDRLSVLAVSRIDK